MDIQPFAFGSCLDLSAQNLDDVHMQCIYDYLQQNPSIRLLNLRKNNVTAHGAHILAQCQQLTRLIISDNQLMDEGVRLISQLSNLKLLDISANKVTHRGAKAFVKHPQLRELYIDSNNLGDTGAILLAQNRDLQVLDLGANKIGPVGTKAFKDSPLLSFNLRSNDIGAEGVISLAHNPFLKRLCIANNKIDDPRVLQILAANSSLRELDISHNTLGAHLPLLGQSSTLCCLNAGWNHVRDEALRAFTKNKVLQTFILNGNHISDVGALLLCEMERLVYLALENNQIGTVGLIRLMNSTIIRHLSINGNLSPEDTQNLLLESPISRANRVKKLQAPIFPTLQQLAFFTIPKSLQQASTLPPYLQVSPSISQG